MFMDNSNRDRKTTDLKVERRVERHVRARRRLGWAELNLRLSGLWLNMRQGN